MHFAHDVHVQDTNRSTGTNAISAVSRQHTPAPDPPSPAGSRELYMAMKFELNLAHGFHEPNNGIP